jgi:hypothetical protein
MQTACSQLQSITASRHIQLNGFSRDKISLMCDNSVFRTNYNLVALMTTLVLVNIFCSLAQYVTDLISKYAKKNCNVAEQKLN